MSLTIFGSVSGKWDDNVCPTWEREESFKGSNQRMRLSGVCNRTKFDLGYWKAKNTSDFTTTVSPSLFLPSPLFFSSSFFSATLFHSINEAAAFHCGLILLPSFCNSSSISLETTRYVFFSLSFLIRFSMQDKDAIRERESETELILIEMYVL